MRDFSCFCLNILGSFPIQEKLGRINLKTNDLPTKGDDYEFFLSALGPFERESVRLSTQHDQLMIRQRVMEWTIYRCLNCDSYVYATSQQGNLGTVLINGNLERDEGELTRMMQSDKYSMPFKIILKPMESVVPAFSSGINDDVRIKNFFGKLQEYISEDTLKTEAEIRRLTMEMNQRRDQAEKDFKTIAALIEASHFTEAPKSTINIGSLTPPVTPESISDKMMAIDDQLPHKTIKFSDKINRHDGSSKHGNLLRQQQTTRTIDFDEDIFEFDGIRSNGMNGIHNPHKYSDNDDGSDSDGTEIRAYNRGRSGSINIARSAPITMPQFNHAAHPLDEAKATNDQMDIASSIKMLARSIHNDSKLFGDLPNRSVLRFNDNF
ncbi:CLUMA_CG001888, isoform A [Clunio marinus]|uniref:CLUMA_CG001888, isoform A n=1 Tax=Clunio marinus TaxID=568069 RepID=A0A1J1HJA1_9DIPT|nr:CLUMA_CG001888, isoform A [Clunio marinus]